LFTNPRIVPGASVRTHGAGRGICRRVFAALFAEKSAKKEGFKKGERAFRYLLSAQKVQKESFRDFSQSPVRAEASPREGPQNNCEHFAVFGPNGTVFKSGEP